MTQLIENEHKTNALQVWYQNNPALAQRNIDESRWNALCTTIYPGAKADSIIMAVDYCESRQLDVMLKPVHLVPMNVKNAQTGSYEWRDVPIPGIGMYRIQSARSGNVAGMDEPIFGDMITESFTDKNGKQVSVTYPEWCSVTVHKIVGDRVVSYVGKEYWIENYATEGKNSDAPNSMWKKRPRGQLAKCAEAQALRKGWPEIDQGATAEEMDGKHFEYEINPISSAVAAPVTSSVKNFLNKNSQQKSRDEVAAEYGEREAENFDSLAPSFDNDPVTLDARVKPLIDSLSDCYEPAAFKEWKQKASVFAEGTPERTELSAAYARRKAFIEQQTTSN